MNKQEALDALHVWCEGEGEAFPSSREGAELVWLASWAARDEEVANLRAENAALRRLLRSPYQGEYAYVSERAIDQAVAAELAKS